MAAKTNKKTVKPAAKKVVKKQAKKERSKKLTFTKYAIYFETASILLAIAALTLNLCDCIDINIMLDLFGLSVIFLAFSLFPRKEA